ncbi:MAG: ADP-ribosylglycohydrolase family protein [Phycisphaerales bacterium]|jgi:ADP-ribosylglycohydrolase
MFYAAKGDYVETVRGAVNCGSDDDSSVGLAGTIAGEFGGLGNIPPAWIELVEVVSAPPSVRKPSL